MKVIYSSRQEKVPLSSLKKGDCFHHRKCLYMVVNFEDWNVEDVNDCYNVGVVDFEYSCLDFLDSSIMVEPIKAQVVVEE